MLRIVEKTVQSELEFEEFVAIRQRLSVGFSKDQLQDMDNLISIDFQKHYSKCLSTQMSPLYDIRLNWIDYIKNSLGIPWKCHNRSSESTKNSKKSVEFDNISQQPNVQSIQEEEFNSSRFGDFKKEIQVLLGTEEDNYVSQQNIMKRLVTIVQAKSTTYDFLYCLLTTPIQEYSGGNSYCGRLILWTVCDILSAIPDSSTTKKFSSGISNSLVYVFTLAIRSLIQPSIDKSVTVKTELIIQEFVAIRQRLSLGFSNPHLEKIDKLVTTHLGRKWTDWVKNNPWKTFIHFRTIALDNEVQILDNQIQPNLKFNQSNLSNNQKENSEIEIINTASKDSTTPASINQTILDNSPKDLVNNLPQNSLSISNIIEHTSKSNKIPAKVKALFKKCLVCGTDYYSSETVTHIRSKPSLDLNNHSCMNAISKILGKNWYSKSIQNNNNCVSNCKANSKHVNSQDILQALQVCPNCKLTQEKFKSPYTIPPFQKNSDLIFDNIPKTDLPHTSCTEPTTNSWGASSILPKSSTEPNSNTDCIHILVPNSNDSDISNMLPISNDELNQNSESETNILQSDEPPVNHSPDCECMCQSLLEELLNSHNELPSLNVNKKNADTWLTELQEIKI